MFAEQTLDWNQKMRRFGEDLPGLARAVFDPAAAPDTKLRAAALCLAHAQALDKLAEKLNRNIYIALPRASRNLKPSPNSEKRFEEEATPEDKAVAIFNTSRNISQRIYLFINPQDHAVDLSDLKDPGLLESLKTLRSMLAAFQRALLQRRESGQ
jgi:hypothetical protein